MAQVTSASQWTAAQARPASPADKSFRGQDFFTLQERLGL
jgi:hypothetical protein